MRLDIGCIDKPQVRNSMPHSIRKLFFHELHGIRQHGNMVGRL